MADADAEVPADGASRLHVSSAGAMQDWAASLRSSDLASVLAWLSLDDSGYKAVRLARVLAVLDTHHNLVCAAADAFAFVGSAADAPYANLFTAIAEHLASTISTDGALDTYPDTVKDAEWIEGTGFFSSDFSSGSPPPSGRRGRGSGRGGRGRGGGRGGSRGRRGSDSASDSGKSSDSDLSARLAKLEASMGGSGGGGGSFSAAEVQAIVAQQIKAAFDDVNTGRTALVLSATQKQRKSATEWKVSPSMAIFDHELPAAGVKPVNVFKAARGDGAGTDGGVRDLLEWNVLRKEERAKLLLRYPASNIWIKPTEIVQKHKPKYQALGLVSADDALRQKQKVLLESVRPLFAGLSHLSDVAGSLNEFAPDLVEWDDRDRRLIEGMHDKLEASTQAFSDMFHLVASQVSELREQRDSLFIQAESGIKDAKADVEEQAMQASPERASTARPDLVQRAKDMRERRKQLGLKFDVAAGAPRRDPRNPWGNGGAGGGGNGGKGKYNTQAQIDRAKRRNAKKSAKRGAKQGGVPPEPQAKPAKKSD